MWKPRRGNAKGDTLRQNMIREVNIRRRNKSGRKRRKNTQLNQPGQHDEHEARNL